MRERAAMALDRMRRAGATTLLVSHEEELIRRLADEVWWLHEGKLAGRGDPEEILAAYRKHVAARLRAWGETRHPAALPARAPRRRPRRDRARRNHRRERPARPWSGAAANSPWSRVTRAIPRSRGRPGGRHHDPHPHRPERLRHQHRTGTSEARPVRRRRHARSDASPSAANCAPASTPSPWRPTIPTASGTTGWRTPWPSRSATPATPRASRICVPR